jgi:hypothetical protein
MQGSARVRKIKAFEEGNEELFLQILEISDRELQAALHGVENLDLARSLLDAPADIVAKIMINLSPRAQILLREDIARLGNSGLWATPEGEIKVDTSSEAKQESRARFFEVLLNTELHCN